jgi:hypothetical protein
VGGQGEVVPAVEVGVREDLVDVPVLLLERLTAVELQVAGRDEQGVEAVLLLQGDARRGGR